MTPSTPKPAVRVQSASRRVSKPAKTFAYAAMMVVAVVLAYANSFAGVFLLDDIRSIVQNAAIRLWPPSLSPLAGPDLTVSGRPLATVTLAANYAMAPGDARDVFAPDDTGVRPEVTERFRRNVWGYHALNLVIHLLATLALFGIARRTLERDPLRRRFGASAGGLACAIALLWALHPLQTESVTYIVQRVESLMGLFFLLTMYCAIRASGTRASGWWAAAAIASSACGMASKAVMVVVPFVVMLWDWTFGEGERFSTPRRVRLYLGLAATWLVLVALVVDAPRAESVGFGLRGWTAWAYLLTQTQVIVHYLRLIVVPSPLVLLYDWRPVTSLADVLPQAGFLLMLAAATAYAIFTRHPLGFAGGAFLLILAPTSSVLPIVTEVAAEHRMYLPLAAVVAVVVLSVYLALGRVASGRARTIAGTVVAAAVGIGLGALTSGRNTDYASETGMWSTVVATQPESARAHAGLGLARLRERRYADAETSLRHALVLQPDNAFAQAGLGAALVGERRFVEAIPWLERAQSAPLDSVDVLDNLAAACAATGDFAKAAANADAAASLARAQGHPAEAATLAQRAAMYRLSIKTP